VAESKKFGTDLGTVGIRNFDQGIVETLGGKISHNNYYVEIEGVDPPPHTPSLPGIPITFAFPEEVFEKYRMPAIVVSRDDIMAANERWHPFSEQWRAPAEGALPVTVSVGGNPVTGWTKAATRQQAAPFDITYTVSCFAQRRGMRTRNRVNKILDFILRRYTPTATIVKVIDSIGDTRLYECHNEGIAHLDDVAGVGERVLGFAVTLRVEGELDLGDPYTSATVLQSTTNLSVI